MSRGQKSVSPAIELVGRVLREQGLGRHIDQDFIAAATTEMQEAMGMSPAEFEAAAAALLAAETEGAFRCKIESILVNSNNMMIFHSFRIPGRDMSISESLVTSSEALTLTPEPSQATLTPSPPVPSPRRKK